MKVSQTILVVLLTAILCVFVGMVVQNNIEDNTMRVVVFAFTLLSWVFLVVTIDLYTSIAQLRNDMNSYLPCN